MLILIPHFVPECLWYNILRDAFTITKWRMKLMIQLAAHPLNNVQFFPYAPGHIIPTHRKLSNANVYQPP